MTHLPRARRRTFRARIAHLALAFAFGVGLTPIASMPVFAREISSRRMTPVVVAVRHARAAVVSIRGQKLVSEAVATADSSEASETPHQVNGMGTGTIIDERGYILTNFHVVSDVRRIEVTLDDGRGVIAELVASDPAADLAVIKIPATKPLSVIRIGTSSDLMVGESVIALGNAFGYEQTVTRGVVSALGRDVQVSDTQSYDDLIQTDASINPGNSGGPLLNIDGEMIGVNVAVRAGAQGIGFAIPIDSALNVASKLLSVQRLRSRWHGLVTQAEDSPDGPLRVSKVERTSPAERVGIQPGDQIVRIGSQSVSRPLDLERAFLDRAIGEFMTVEVRRGDQNLKLELALSDAPVVKAVTAPPALAGDDARVWDVFGLNLSEEPHTTFDRRSTRYRGGMHVNSVRPNSPASQEGIQPGDILVGMHKWETASEQDVKYIISRPNLEQLGKVKFYVLRGQNTLYGHINMATKPDSPGHATARH
jgi:serine protease Do